MKHILEEMGDDPTVLDALFLGTHRRIENKVGYWGASNFFVTSFINWCEKDYEHIEVVWILELLRSW